MAEGVAPVGPEEAAEKLREVYVDRLGLMTVEEISILPLMIKLHKDLEHRRTDAQVTALLADCHTKVAGFVASLNTIASVRMKAQALDSEGVIES